MDLSAFTKAGKLASLGEQARRWRPGLGGARHSEVFASAREAGGAAAALALALDGLRAEGLAQRSVLWVQDAAALRLGGRPYRPGLPEPLRHRLIHVAARTPEDMLFALEEGVRCRDLAFVIGELAGNPKALDLTASRRLSLAAEKHGVPLMLVRLDAARDLSSARMRWQVRSAPSPAPRWNAFAPGAPAWRAELFRARGHAPGEWILRDDAHGLAADRIAAQRTETPDHGDLAFAAGDRSLAAIAG
jgi:protein ImuA